MSFLKNWQSIQMGLDGDRGDFDEALLSAVARGKDVVVIGGGDTGNDCIGTSLRQVTTAAFRRLSIRCTQVTQVCPTVTLTASCCRERNR